MKHFEIEPNKGLGPYELGENMTAIIKRLQTTKTANKSHIEIIYHKHKPLSKDIQIRIEEEGIILFFEPIEQRLQHICCIDMTKTKLFYKEVEIRNGLASIYKIFGPTYKGIYTEEGRYRLTYPGLMLEFEIPAEVLELAKTMDQPLEFPKPHVTPICKNIIIYYGPNYEEKRLPKIQNITGNIAVRVNLKKGIVIQQEEEDATKEIEFGDTPQEILLKLGMPNSIFYKQTNRYSIHQQQSHHTTKDIIMKIHNPITIEKSKDKQEQHIKIKDIKHPKIKGEIEKVKQKVGKQLKYIEPIDKTYSGAGFKKIQVATAIKLEYAEETFIVDIRFYYNEAHPEKVKMFIVEGNHPLKKKEGYVEYEKYALFKGDGKDYFYNYNQYGMDMLFDGATHVLRKIILHTNFPGSKDFNIYVRCPFEIDMKEFHNTLEGTFGPQTKVSTILVQLNKIFQEQEPLVGSDTLNENPFGGTRYYSFPYCIIEALNSDYINSITLF